MRDPFHEGERLVQASVGLTHEADAVGTMLAASIAPRALPFLAQQRLLVVATTNETGQPWVSLLFGPPGFVRSLDGSSIDVDVSRLAAIDPLWRNLTVDPAVGTLAIDLATRRRLRVNGTGRLVDARTLRVIVTEAYPNCPKYIQQRSSLAVAAVRPLRPSVVGERLGAEQIETIRQSDTMFVASRHPSRGADASHRGGAVGFIEVVDATRLRIPDYKGNAMFNTLGNLAVAPRVALSIVNFAEHRVLDIIGNVTIETTPPARGTTGLAWEVAISGFHAHDLPPALAWSTPEASPFNPPL